LPDFTWNPEEQPAELWDLYANKASAGSHLRIHPLLHFTELDVWRYIALEKIPVCELYFARGGKRYRSIGCAPCCEPVESQASSLEAVICELEEAREEERAGRAQDKEDLRAMEQLRALGYL